MNCHRRRRFCIFFALLWTAAWASAAPPQRADVSAALSYTALQPGQQAVAAIVLDVHDGFHAQSHTPSNPNFIAMVVTLDENPALTALPPVYPAGKNVTYPDLGKLNVYTGRVIVHIPLHVKADAPPGLLKIAGSVVFQLCDEHTCYPPPKPPAAFTIETSIVPAGAAVQTQNPELFTGFDPTVFSRAAPAAPPSVAAAVSAASLQLFGWSFSLGSGAYLLAFGVAFVVGILFNLMPCVLPVVPLKAIGFYEVSQHNRAKCFFLGCVFSLGLLTSFAILAQVVVVYRSLTWGQQFSNPWFVWSIVAILTVMALSMFGAFSVLLPSGVYRFTPRHDTIAGNYLFGMFAAVLSTPCTAPMFVGLLVWAAQQPKWIGVSLVMMVGLGMAFPYLILSAFPEAARRFPRTGPWAELLKQLMGFLLLGVAVYFAAGRLIEGGRFFWAVFAVVAAGGAFLVIRTFQLTHRPGFIGAASAVAMLLVGSTLWFTLGLAGPRTSADGRELIAWQPYSVQALEEASRGGKIAMVEFTANWCANCLELEARVFRDPRAAAALAEHRVVALRADLTRDDAPGWEKLRQVNPSGGIPLTVIYSPTQTAPLELSSIYTTQNLIDAIKRAAVPPVSSPAESLGRR